MRRQVAELVFPDVSKGRVALIAEGQAVQEGFLLGCWTLQVEGTTFLRNVWKH